LLTWLMIGKPCFFKNDVERGPRFVLNIRPDA
jgi:hypothetical protein